MTVGYAIVQPARHFRAVGYAGLELVAVYLFALTFYSAVFVGYWALTAWDALNGKGMKVIRTRPEL
jgi:hypothetical protein